MTLVKCPNCRKEIEWSESEYRPFCSEKCKMIDLGEWIDGNYSVPDESTPLDDKDMREIESALENGAENKEQF